MRTGFDHDLYTRMQSDNIRSRIAAFGGKLCDWAESCLTIFMHRVCCRASSRTARYPCCST